MSPSWSSTICLEMASPRPRPPTVEACAVKLDSLTDQNRTHASYLCKDMEHFLRLASPYAFTRQICAVLS
jgi:hypothetical protein